MANLNALHKAGFSRDATCKLEALRRRHQQARLQEHFTPAELRRLEFIRGLVRRGRLNS